MINLQNWTGWHTVQSLLAAMLVAEKALEHDAALGTFMPMAEGLTLGILTVVNVFSPSAMATPQQVEARRQASIHPPPSEKGAIQ
jgi:hypothetical protein